MPHFHYKAVDAAGNLLSGSVEAGDRKSAVRQLAAQGYQPLKLTSASSPAFQIAPKKEKTTATRRSPFRRKRSKDTLALAFLNKIHPLHKSGMPIGDVVKNLHLRLNDPDLKALATHLWQELSEGHSFAAAVRQRSDIFDRTASFLIEAGEATGNLVPVLENIIANLEDRIALRKRVLGGLAYPLFICTLAMGIAAMLLFFLLPRMEKMMTSMGDGMSLPAKVLMGLSEAGVVYGPFAIIGILIAAVALERWRKTERGRTVTDAWLLRIPIVRGIVTRIDTCRMGNLLATLLSSGVNTTEALRLTERTISNRHLQARFREARSLINDGASFSAALGKHHLLEDTDLDILGIGENTGHPAASFREIYAQHNEALGRQLNQLTTVIAGSALGFAFVLVMIILLSVLTSVFDLSQSILSR